jgi:hypothetical protein
MKPYPAFEANPKILEFEEMCKNWTWKGLESGSKNHAQSCNRRTPKKY